MAKKTDRDRALKKQRDSAKRIARKKEVKRASPPTPPKGTRGGVPVVTAETFPDNCLRFWLCHGMNFIVSSYDDGNWTPLFPGIYEDKIPTPAEIARTVVEHFSGIKTWSLDAKAAVAWSVTDRAVVYIYYKEAMRRVQSVYPEAEDVEDRVRQPHNPIVWELFKYLKDKLLKRSLR